VNEYEKKKKGKGGGGGGKTFNSIPEAAGSREKNILLDEPVTTVHRRKFGSVIASRSRCLQNR